MEQAHASGDELERALGHGEVGDFLPGLGELTAWGLYGDVENRSISGALVTGFQPSPETVSVMMTAIVTNARLELGPLALLAELPRHCFEQFALRTWLLYGPGITVLDRGRVILQTRSREAAKLCKELLAHLVRDADVLEREDDTVSGTPLFVKQDGGGIVTDYRMAPPLTQDQGWIHVEDWR
jgi:hypothetical protein